MRIIFPAILIIAILVGGCATVPKGGLLEGPVLPDRPSPVLMDNGKFDKKKYPDTKWINKPKEDASKGIACWSYKEVQIISDALADWQVWADTVESIVSKYNNELKGGATSKAGKPWYRRIF